MTANAGFHEPASTHQARSSRRGFENDYARKTSGPYLRDPRPEPFSFGIVSGGQHASGQTPGIHHPSTAGLGRLQTGFGISIPLAIAIIIMAVIAGFRVTTATLNKPQLTTLEYRHS